jgi:hypothetical protein
MSSNNAFKDDLFSLYNIVQASMIVYPKELVIAALRDFFSQSSYYHFSKDHFGFPNVQDHTDLLPGADLPTRAPGSTAVNNIDLVTRLFIGENYNYGEGIFYPAILVKNGGTQYIPISINRNQGTIEYSDIIYEDGYGNQTLVKTPAFFVTSGAWEGSIIIDVMTRSLRSRDDLVEAIGMYFTEIKHNTLVDIGLIIRPPSISAPSETDDRNDKLFKQTITLPYRTEWERKIPITTLIDTILFSIEFQDLNHQNTTPAPNLTINMDVSINDILLNL